MNYPIKRTVYALEDGTVTLDSGKGKNRVIFVLGNEVPWEEAERLRLPALDKAADEKEAEDAKSADALSHLKPAKVAEIKEITPSTPTAPKATEAK